MTNALPIGHILQNEYKIEKILGAGGFGITYLARDMNLNYQVVIKEFLPQDMATRDQSRITVTPFTKDTKSYDHLLKRFSEEAQLLASMRHPNIVKVTRFFKENNTAYFVMEYSEGETLKEYLQRHGVLKEEEILSIMIPILEGTKYVHSKGFLHRDIAPDNIYLTKNGMPILIDFGAARDAIAEESKNISSIVKEGYSSPEQYTINNKQNSSSDIYALGAVFYRMITGKVPVNAPHRQTALLNDEADPMGYLPTQYRGKYSQKLLHAVAKAMNIRATDRFASVSEFQNALVGDVIVDSAPSSTSRHIASTAQNNTNNNNDSGSKNGILMAFIAVLLLLGWAGYIYMEQNNSNQPTQTASITEPTNTALVASSNDNEELEKAKRELAALKQKQQEVEAERIRKEQEEIERLKEEKARARREELERLRQEKTERERAEGERMERAADEAKRKIQGISRSEILSFISKYISYGNRRDIKGVMSLYHTKVDYFRAGNVSKKFIYKDKVNYYNRWPIIELKFVNLLSVNNMGGVPYNKIVKYSLDFDVYNYSKQKGIRGRAINTVILKKENGELKIVSDKQKVLNRSKY